MFLNLLDRLCGRSLVFGSNSVSVAVTPLHADDLVVHNTAVRPLDDVKVEQIFKFDDCERRADAANALARFNNLDRLNCAESTEEIS